MEQITFPIVGNSIIMAVVIVIHVFLAFFAAGGMALIVFSESLSRKKSDQPSLDFMESVLHGLADMMKVNGVLGVVIVVLTIGLWTKFAAALYGITFWAFVAEGVTFLVMMSSSVIYRRTWQGNSSTHKISGVVAAISSLLAAFLINGIWSFMLMPGEWLKTQNSIDAFFNPILWESSIHLLLPTLVNTAGLFFLITLFKVKKNPELDNLNRLFAKIIMWEIIIQPISGVLFALKLKQAGDQYLMSPRPFDQIMHGAATPFFIWMVTCAVIALTSVLIYAVRGHEKGKNSMVVAIFALYVAFVGGAFTRERARKPFLIHSFMYMNMKTVMGTAEAAIPHNPEALKGDKVFKDSDCISCHSIKGAGGSYGPSLDGISKKMSDEQMKAFIRKPTNENMPPFTGSDDELKALVEYLETL